MSLRVVLDTNVLVAGLRSDRGASRALLIGALERRFQPLISVPLMMEYEAVLTRQEHLDAAGLSGADVQDVLDGLAAVVEPVRLAFLWRPTLADAADDMVLETAVNGRADALVTLNRRHFLPAASVFGLAIASPAATIAKLGKRK